MGKSLDKRKLLEQLDPIPEDQEYREDDPLQKMSLADALLGLASVNHETEYALCRDVAIHLSGQVREPDDVELDEELEGVPPVSD